MILLILASLLVGSLASPLMQSLSVHDDGSYEFFYETGKEGGSHSRTEVRHPDGVVEGKYSYEDPNGDIREVKYRADDFGYVANGDVSVEGAPKGQFPLAVEESQDIASPPESSEVQDISVPELEQPKIEPYLVKGELSNEEQDNKEEDDIKDLSLDESGSNDPPEAFPPGFFNQNFQGLRRLPEPTSEKSTVPEATTGAPEEEKSSEQDVDSSLVEQPIPPTDVRVDLTKLTNEKSNFGPFMPIRPFQAFPAHTDSSMLHQPVYVFSYQQPDSYGYHYFF